MYTYTVTTSDAESGRKACRPKGGLEKAHLRRCRTDTYRLDTLYGSTPSIWAFSDPS